MLTGSAHAEQDPFASPVAGVGLTENLGGQVNLHTSGIKDETGKSVHLGDYFKRGQPVILVLAYFQCPNLCMLLLNGVVDSLKQLDWTAGKEYEFVVLSIDPKETPEIASKKKAALLQSYGRPEAAKGWHFLTAEESSIQSVAKQIGFSYVYNEVTKQYAHTAALYVLTPKGVISRYLYGLSFDVKNLRFSLIDASNGKVGSMVEKVMLFCFHFNPDENSYTFKVWKLVQVILAIQALVLFGFLWFLWKRERPSKPS